MTAAMTRPKLRVAAPSPRRRSLTLDLVSDEAGFHALQPFWDALLDQCATRTPFLRWDWVSLWWQECRGNAQLAIAVLRDVEGVPHAIAPLMLARESNHARQHLVALAFLGGFGEAHGERLDLIVPAGREAELTPQLCLAFKLLRPQCDLVRLNHLPEESPNTPHILAALQAGFSRVGVLNRHASRFISLPTTWDELESRHNAAWRGNLRRIRKAFTTRHTGIASYAGERVTHTQAFEELRRLHAMNFPAGVSTFTTPASWRFHQRLAAKWLPEQRAVLPLLESGGHGIAAIYGFIERGEFFQYQMGWDHALSPISPGKLAMRWSIDRAIQQRLRVYDLLPGEYAYKQQWCDATRWVLDLEAANPSSWRATVFHTLRTARRLAKNFPEGLAA